jgi:hypothetical protein
VNVDENEHEKSESTTIFLDSLSTHQPDDTVTDSPILNPSQCARVRYLTHLTHPTHSTHLHRPNIPTHLTSRHVTPYHTCDLLAAMEVEA